MTASRRVVIAILAWGAFAFGAVYPWAYWPLAVGAAALGWWAVRATGGWPRVQPRAVLWGFVAVAVGMAVQLTPLPYAQFVRLAPAADRFLGQYNLAYAVRPPTWHSLSIAPSSTLVALALFMAFGLFMFGTIRLLSRLRLDAFVNRLITLGLVLAVVGIVQKGLAPRGRPTLVYGFWQPHFAGNVFGPFINRNHFATWMVMVLPVTVGYLAAILQSSQYPTRRDWGRWARWLATPEASRAASVAFCALAMGASLVLTGSRSGIASFGASVAVLAYFAARRVSDPRMRRVAVAALVVLLIVAVVWAGFKETVTRFTLTTTDLPGRVTAWRDTLKIFADFPIFGIGFGTYVYAMLIYQSGARDAIFFQAHNDYLQLFAEGGLLVGIPIVVTLWLIARAVKRRLADRDSEAVRSWVRFGAIAGLVGVAVQSTVEFGLQMPGNAALFVVILALALQRESSHAHAYRV